MIIQKVENLLKKLGFFRMGEKIKEKEGHFYYIEKEGATLQTEAYTYNCEIFYLHKNVLIKVKFTTKYLTSCDVYFYKRNEKGYMEHQNMLWIDNENINELEKEIKKYIN